MGNHLSTISFQPPARPLQGLKGRGIYLPQTTHNQLLLRDRVTKWITSVAPFPYYWTKSPEEHSREARIARHNLPEELLYLTPSAPPGFVQVRFFMSLEMMKHLEWTPNMVAFVPLEPSGELDLRRVKRLWGLETCVAVDPTRWKPFETSRPEMISAVGVRTLSLYYESINVIEPCVSKATLRKREFRQKWGPYLDVLYSAWRDCQRFVDRSRLELTEVLWLFEEWASAFADSELGRILSAVLIFALVLFIASAIHGYIDLGIGNRFRKWTGLDSRMKS